ncbi:hypothetical protein MMC25_003298 [Agyrium rufum]|nr:hypothetical protein [Agyrium rufum]
MEAPSAHHKFGGQSPSAEAFAAVNSAQSSRRPSRRPSANAAQSTAPTTPQQQAYRSPPSSQPSSAATAKPLPNPTTQTSPIIANAAPSEAYHSPQRDYRANADPLASTGPVPPPRTSSNQRGANLGNQQEYTLADRTATQGEGRTFSHAAETRNGGAAGERRYQESDNSYLDPTANRDRRQYSPSGRAYRPSSSREATSQAEASSPRHRSATDMQQPAPPSRPIRENSEIINRVVVTDPSIDIEREQERIKEAIPASNGIQGDRAGEETADAAAQGGHRSRQDHSASAARRKETKFGEYVLGQTLGEGEFGKVKLGWKKDGSVQVAIKLIRRENLTTNPNRQNKIYREISILRGLSHPNIVRLHEMVETERHIGIILEYASGGELFDYILNHRYLKDGAARRLFAQLISGVGYLHKKGIVHRDLKLENLLLDRNRNIIITDFGFANNFDPHDELGEDIENRLTDKSFVKHMELDKVTNGVRRGDLMGTSCGSPCYAAPELVVTDGLYTGRKVDVWSCGVILYAMLAGYLPFDDDPANPEGDDIHLLYRYIVSTPLTFPEYVTPHARDLLRRILVPDPRKRADLFEVARHSWLSDFAHVVAHVTSSTTTVGDLAGANLPEDDRPEAPLLARSASVREPSKPQTANLSPVGGLTHAGKLDTDNTEKAKGPRDAKRRTVQVEYVAPQSQTLRGESAAVPATSPQERYTQPDSMRTVSSTQRKPLPQESPATTDSRQYSAAQDSLANLSQKQQRIGTSQSQMQPPTRPGRDVPRSVSDSTAAFGQMPASSIARPNTGGSMASSSGNRLPSRGNSYSQPVAPTVATTNAQGKVTQPKNGRQYNISGPIPQADPSASGTALSRSGSQHTSARQDFAATPDEETRTHRRSTTLGGVFSKPGTLFGAKPQPQPSQEGVRPPREKQYPPTSMRAPIANEGSPRISSESRRPSFGFGRKSSDISKSEKQEKPRRFSLLPASFSFKSFGGSSKDPDAPGSRHSRKQSSSTQGMAFGRGAEPSQSYDSMPHYDGQKERNRQASNPQVRPDQRSGYGNVTDPMTTTGGPYNASAYRTQQQAPPSTSRSQNFPQQQSYLLESGSHTNPELSVSGSRGQQQAQQQQRPQYPPGFNSYDDSEQPSRTSFQQQPTSNTRGNGRGPGVLQKPNRKFLDAYDESHDPGHHAGSSSAAKRVMDFFRRRGKARTGDI